MKEYHGMEWINAVNNGREIVVVSSNESENSAIFWKRDNVLWSFSKEFGAFPRTPEEFSGSDFVKHLETMETEGARIFIRGYK